jgi:hypothetical protein
MSSPPTRPVISGENNLNDRVNQYIELVKISENPQVTQHCEYREKTIVKIITDIHCEEHPRLKHVVIQLYYQ